MENKISKNLKETYNKYANEREKSETQQWKIDQRKAFIDLIKRENKSSLLEIGAGPGRDSKFFMDQGLEVVATDLSSEMVKLCKDKGIRAYELEFDDLERINEKFDAVWALNCLLHVEKKKLPNILDKIKSVLKPSGVFFMGVYGGEDSEGVWEGDFYDPPRFFSSYTDAQIQKVVSQHFELLNFETVESGGNRHFQSLTLRKR